ncbi:MAG: helix-turn-helix domain-containing protein [Cellvibrio sp.]
MREFYNKALLALLGLLVVSALIAYACVKNSYIHLRLLPAEESGLVWHSEATSDQIRGGRSTIKINEDRSSLNFDFTISQQAEYPNAAAEILFNDENGKNVLADLSAYDTISFNAKCSPANVLTLGILTFDDKISVREDFLTYRGPATFISCKESWTRIERDLTRLETPLWWLEMFKQDLTNTSYKLDKVPKISFGSTSRSPLDVNSNVQLDEIALHGRNWNYIYLLGVLILTVWGLALFLFFKKLTQVLASELRDKIQRDRPLVAYQQLSLEPYKDKEKSAILRFMATEYANTDLDVETMVTTLGVNRNKINDILKAEMGYTFTAYLNKLRLTEAARLLAEKEDASVAEIAYLVGYKNVSYFNKLFKEEYNCTPKMFKTLYNEVE